MRACNSINVSPSCLFSRLNSNPSVHLVSTELIPSDIEFLKMSKKKHKNLLELDF